jgi:regulatory protein
MAMPHSSQSGKPLDIAALERLALRYVERFQTTRGKLRRYLERKIRERGWEGPESDPVLLADRMAALGYVDDRAWAEAKAAALTRRGLGARRVAVALVQGQVEREDVARIAEKSRSDAVESALLFARRRRIGPFAIEPAERAAREKQVAALVRAGHDFALARRIVVMAPGADPTTLLSD